MISLNTIKASNAKLPTHLTAVFVGGTAGIGEYTLKAFASHCQHPRAYFIGRSEPAAKRIMYELKKLNSNGVYNFIKSDVSLIKNVDSVCRQIQAKEKTINILFLTTGSLQTGIETEEGLHFGASLLLHSRTRFIVNLLPLLQAAPDLRRVVSVFTGTKEGQISGDNLQARNISPWKSRDHMSSCVSLSLEAVARKAPDVGFIHNFPGMVKSNIARGSGLLNLTMRVMSPVVGMFIGISEEECGERQLYMATSARYPGKDGNADGVNVDKDVGVCEGSNGGVGSGVYVVSEDCEAGGARVVEVLASLRKEAKDELVWNHIQEEYTRITGKSSINA